MTSQLLINGAWAVVLWTTAAATAVMLLGKAPAVVRRNVCRVGLAVVPVVLAGAVAGTVWRPWAGLLVQPVAETVPAASREASGPEEVETAPWAPLAAASEPRERSDRARPALPAEKRPAPLPAGADRHGPRDEPSPAAASSLANDAAWIVDWPAVIFAAAATLAAGLALLLACRLVRLAAWRRRWLPAPKAWVSVTERLARRIGLTRRFRVYVVPGLSQPAAAGVFRPAIALPDRAPRSLGPVLRSALAHELGHLSGRDPMWYVLARAVVALAWWCPAVWWLRRRAEIESELVADDHALACGVRPIDLARTLARFAELGLRRAPAGVSGLACHLRRRIEMILNTGQPHRSKSSGPVRWLLAAAAGLMALGILGTPLIGMARADDGGEELTRPPVVRDAGKEVREGRRDGDREGAERERRRERDREGGERERRREGDREGAERERRREGDREGAERERRRDGDREGAERERRREGEGRVRLPRELQQMIETVKITNAQEAQLKKALVAKENDLRQWRQENAARLREAEQALRRAQETLRRLRSEEREVAGKADARLMGVFTPEQRALWATTRIAKLYDRRNAENPVRLTNRQLDDIDILCEKAQKQLVALGKSSKPPAAVAEAREKTLHQLQRDIYEKVLDDNQRRRSPRPRGLRGEGEGERRREGDREGREREERRIPDRERGEREEGEGRRLRDRDREERGED